MEARSLSLDGTAIIETRVLNTKVLSPVFDDYEIFSSYGLTGAGSGVGILF